MTLTQQTQEKINNSDFNNFSEKEFDLIYDSITGIVTGPEAITLSHDFILKLLNDEYYRNTNALPTLGKIKNYIFRMDTNPKYYAMYINFLIEDEPRRASGTLVFTGRKRKYLGAVIDEGIINEDVMQYLIVSENFLEDITDSQFRVIEDIILSYQKDKLYKLGAPVLGSVFTFSEILEIVQSIDSIIASDMLVRKWINGASEERASEAVSSVVLGALQDIDFYEISSSLFKLGKLSEEDRIRMIQAHNDEKLDLTTDSMKSATPASLKELKRNPIRGGLPLMLTNLFISDVSLSDMDEYVLRVKPDYHENPMYLGVDTPDDFYRDEDIVKYTWFFAPQPLLSTKRCYVTKDTFKVLNKLWKPIVGKTRRWSDELIDFRLIVQRNISMNIDDVEYLQRKTQTTNTDVYKAINKRDLRIGDLDESSKYMLNALLEG